LFADMRERGTQLLTEAGADAGAIDYRPTAEMRHVGQGFEIPVPLPALSLSAGDMPAIRAAFFDSYRLRFGRTMEESPIEVLSWRLACAAPGRDIRIDRTAATNSLQAARRGSRKVLFESHGWQECVVYDRYMLPSGAHLTGPALVEERESTCVIGPRSTAHIDPFRNLVVELET
jgi:N-methylhydantoinase A